MEPESLLPHSQETSTCPYPEPDQSSPHNIPRHFDTQNLLYCKKHYIAL